jgi:hypothetical protein
MDHNQGIARNNFVSDCSVYRAQAEAAGEKDQFVKAVQDQYLKRFPVERYRQDDKKLYDQRVQHVRNVGAYVNDCDLHSDELRRVSSKSFTGPASRGHK